ncbi:MAG: hypothetical protein ACI9OE_000913 [Mariniflexile sp.]|jgi:hypothetical protein
MKKTITIFRNFLFVMFFPLMGIGQTQIGSDIIGETANDWSGRSVPMSADGSKVAIGASFNSDNGDGSGQVRVYQNASGIWTQVGADIDGEAIGDNSGFSVSISADGNTVAIGAYRNDGNGVDSGHVRVYQYALGVWTQIGTDIDGEAASDSSGYSVSLSASGNRVAIGAPNNGSTKAGHVRVYQNNSGTWVQLGIDINGEFSDDGSGESISISADGNRVAIGARFNDGNGSNSGHVRVYKYESSSWTKVGADIDGEAANDLSGFGVSLSYDGKIVAIGATGNDGNGDSSGHVRVYEDVAGVWTQVGTDINGEAVNDKSGERVSLSADGNIVAIGAKDNDGNGSNSGHVRVYKNISGVWTQIGIDIDGDEGFKFGWDISMSSNGTTLAVGSPYYNSSAGLVRVYDFSNLLSNEQFLKSGFLVYPNPVSNNLSIENPFSGNLQLQVFNQLGQLVLKRNTSSSLLDVSNLSKGLYFLNINTENSETQTIKFIKN